MSWDDDENVDQTLFVCKECFVYKLPTRTSSSGFRAADWDINSFLWSGKLTVRSVGEKCVIYLEDPNTGELFATCPVSPGAVESVADSSRYFVLKIDDGKGHHAFVGMGFTERSESFDFNAALQDHQKYLKQKKESAVAKQKLSAMPHKDYSIPEGAKIHVSIKTSKPSGNPNKSTTQGSQGLVLPPPPGSSSSANKKPGTPSITQTQPQSQKTNDMWSDFTGSNSNWSAFN